jgi:hypothetical protein
LAENFKDFIDLAHRHSKMTYFSKKSLKINNLTKIYSHTTINYLISFQEKKENYFIILLAKDIAKKQVLAKKKQKL